MFEKTDQNSGVIGGFFKNDTQIQFQKKEIIESGKQ
jgi:hypothetical protein